MPKKKQVRVRIPIKRVGAMSTVAHRMGYQKVTEIPTGRIKEFVNKLVDSVGERKALGMIRAQILFRKNKPGHARTQFERMDKYLRRKYKGQGWYPKKR